MQLISTKQYHEPSTEYYKRPLLIDQVGSVTEMWRSPRVPVFVNVDIIKQSEEELSISLKSVKDIELLERFFTFNNPTEVKRLLLTRDYLIESLFEAYKQIRRIFGQNIVEVCLEYDSDPEEDFEGLSILVKTNLSPELSLDLLDKFDEEWWLDVDNETRTILTVMVRPV